MLVYCKFHKNGAPIPKSSAHTESNGSAHNKTAHSGKKLKYKASCPGQMVLAGGFFDGFVEEVILAP